jgi:hypothetical protein
VGPDTVRYGYVSVVAYIAVWPCGLLATR